jgi:hypothetical protein
VLTAGHCEPYPQAGSQAYGGTTLPYKGQLYERYWDVQWHTTPGYDDVPRAKDPEGSRPIYGWEDRLSQQVGDYVCKYGKTTGYRCGNISSTGTKPGYIPNGANTFIAVYKAKPARVLSDFGDSGCPWYNGGTALGVHSGGAETKSYHWSFYMPINYARSLDVSIQTY